MGDNKQNQAYRIAVGTCPPKNVATVRLLGRNKIEQGVVVGVPHNSRLWKRTVQRYYVCLGYIVMHPLPHGVGYSKSPLVLVNIPVVI